MSSCGTSLDGVRGNALAHLGVLIGMVAIALAIVAPLSYRTFGTMGLWAAAIAASVCLTAPTVAMFASRTFASHDRALAGLLVAMFVRMGIPLLFCLTMAIVKGQLLDAGIVYCVLIFYLVVLAVDTWFAMRNVEHRQTASGGV